MGFGFQGYIYFFFRGFQLVARKINGIKSVSLFVDVVPECSLLHFIASGGVKKCLGGCSLDLNRFDTSALAEYSCIPACLAS